MDSCEHMHHSYMHRHSSITIITCHVTRDGSGFIISIAMPISITARIGFLMCDLKPSLVVVGGVAIV